MVQGLVQAVGVSNYGPKQMTRIHKFLTARGVPLASAQARLRPSPLILLHHHFSLRLCVCALLSKGMFLREDVKRRIRRGVGMCAHA